MAIDHAKNEKIENEGDSTNLNSGKFGVSP